MIVLDTSILVAFNNRSDMHHKRALPAMESLAAGSWGKALLLEYVFAETMNVVKRQLGFSAAIEAGAILRRSHQFDFVPCSELFSTTLAEFQADVLSPLSFVDHNVALVARQRAGGKILTFDKAFRQVSGITVLPE